MTCYFVQRTRKPTEKDVLGEKGHQVLKAIFKFCQIIYHLGHDLLEEGKVLSPDRPKHILDSSQMTMEKTLILTGYCRQWGHF